MLLLLFMFCVGFFCLPGMWEIALETFPALESQVLTTGPPGKSWECLHDSNPPTSVQANSIA